MAQSAFERTLVQGGIPAAAAKKVVEEGYEDATHIIDSFTEQSAWVSYMQELVCDQGLTDVAVAPEAWGRHPLKGKAVAMWRDFEKRSFLPPQAAGPAAPGFSTGTLPGMPKKCDPRERLRLEAVLASLNSSFLVTSSIKACDDTFDAIWSCVSSWIPWKKTVSEKEKDWIDLQKSQSISGTRTQAEILSQAYGLDTTTLDESPGARNAVRNTIECRLLTVAVVESVSIVPFCTYVAAFMDMYGKKYLPGSSLRGPDKSEGEEADREAWREVVRLRQTGLPWKEAIEEVVLVREIFRSRLDGRPKAMVPGNQGNGKGGFQRQQSDAGKGTWSKGFQKGFGKKRKGDGKGNGAPGDSKKAKMSFCFGFQEGACDKGDGCRFLHRCSVCYSKEHGSGDPNCKGEQ